MAPKVKAAVGMVSDAIETACGWAIVVFAVYGLLFVDVTGNGRLWDAVVGVARESTATTAQRNTAVQTRVVPVRPVDPMKKAQDRMLLIPEEPQQEIAVPVLASNQPTDQMTDAPADAGAGKTWKKSLKGSLRTFTVYGNGEEHSSASASAGSAPAAPSAHASAPVVTVASADSAYRAGTAAATARPGVSSRASSMGAAPSDGVRNFR